jgi:hypothetical protein
MPAVSEMMVREFFELHGFLVRQPRKYTLRSARGSDEADLFVVNPRPLPLNEPLPFLLAPEDLDRVSRGVVVVKGWHTETFSANRLALQPEIFRFASPAVVRRAARELGKLGEGGPVCKILVVPSLPQKEDLRRESVAVMRQNGVDAALPFATLLADLIRRVEVNRDYQKSDLLQALRILKNYGFLSDPQLELFKPARQPRKNPANRESPGEVSA